MKTRRTFLAQRRGSRKDARGRSFASLRLCVSLLSLALISCAGTPAEHAARRATARRIGERAAVVAMQMAANYYLNQEGYRK